MAYERDRRDPVTACLFAMIGFGTKGIRDRQPVEDEAFIYYSGLFGLMPKSALALESVLADYFDIPVELEPFMGAWRSLAAPDQCEFGGECPRIRRSWVSAPWWGKRSGTRDRACGSSWAR